MKLLCLAFAASVAALLGCSSQPIGDEEPTSSAGSSSTGGTDSVDRAPSACSAALRQSLSLVDEVSTAAVAVLSEAGDDRTLYVDASVGGLNEQDNQPWVYLKLATGNAVQVTDIEALTSKAWDLAFKRSVVRTNSGDSGPGDGGAIRIALPWAEVDGSTLGNKALPIESWFDQDCMLERDASQNIITTFSGWSEYDEMNHVLSAAPDVVFITAAADGLLYKVSVLDYYSTPTGTHGTVSGRYKVRTAPLQ